MKVIRSLLLAILASLFATAHAASHVSCSKNITLKLARRAGKTVFDLQKKSYSKYPLGAIGTIGKHCPHIKMYVFVDADVPLNGVLTTLDGSGKDQITQVLFFVTKNGLFLPLTFGSQTSDNPSGNKGDE